MSVIGVNNILASYQYAGKTQRTETQKTDFAKQLQSTAESEQTRVDSYTEYLKSKYGNVSIA